MSVPVALEWSVENCTIARALEVVGDRATFLVLREVSCGVRRFDDMRVRTGMSRQVLSDRLVRLVEEDLLRRHPYQEPGQRVREEYRLTEKGFALFPVLVSLLEWGNRYVADAEGPALDVVHRGCGEPVHPMLGCESGHVLDDPRELLMRPGRGAHRLSAVDAGRT